MPEEKKKQPFNYQYIFATRKFLVMAVGLAMSSLIMGAFFLFPNVTKVQSLLSEIEDQNLMLKNLQTKQNTLQNVNNIDLFAKKDQIDAILPSSKPVLQLLQQIERISGENSIIVSEFGVVPGEISTQSAQETDQPVAPKTLSQSPNLDFIETEIAVIGTIDGINSFLKAINRITPMTETSELTLKSVNREDLVAEGSVEDARVFEANLHLISYFYVGQVEVNASQALPQLDQFTAEESAQLDEFQVPVSSTVPVDLNIQGGGKEDLFE